MSTQNVHMVRKSLAKSVMTLLVLMLLLPVAAPAMAQDKVAPGKDMAIAPSQRQGPTDAAELEAFLDGLLAKEMEENHIAGAAVSVVKDGKLFLAKGYGYADLENKTPVDPEQTLFPVGSVGKLFTWTAMMQLVEQGKLDLDADVNAYLDLRVPDTYPQPITLKHLMTHTSGFDDGLVGQAISDAKDAVPAREWLITHMAARVRPPGEAAAYSNYNAMLAGYIVARVSGQPYEQYIQEHILDPLGMAHATARWPAPPDLRKNRSVGYTFQDGAFQAFPDYYGQPAALPSGSMQASVTDMARFMIAHLQDGLYGDANLRGVRILKQATAQHMHSTQFTPDPRLRGIAYGFFDFTDNGERTIGHIGYAPPMHSLLLLVPDQNLGVFVVYNSAGGGIVASPYVGFGGAFFDHYYPAPSVEPPHPSAGLSAGRFVGSYRQTSFPYTSFLKVSAAFGGYTAEISDPGDGTLLLATEYGEQRYVQVEPLLFRQVDGTFHLFFREDDRGRITRMFADMMPHTAFDKLDWYETPGFNMALLLGCVLAFLSMIPVAAIRAIRDHRLSADRKFALRGARVACWTILGVSALNLVIVAGTMWGKMGGVTNELLAPPLILMVVLGLGVLSAALTASGLVFAVLAWKNRYWSTTYRADYTVVTVAAVAFVWFLNYWNLLGWRY